MRLLEISDRGELSLTDDLTADIPPYAILSHTWGPDQEEVSFKDLIDGRGKNKEGYTKIQFCADQARKDDLHHFWIDTCCIDKTNLVELSEAIVSMFQWYANAEWCYVFLPDVSACKRDNTGSTRIWESAFRKSRWFTRGWTLQELLAPRRVEFYSRERVRLGDKDTLEQVIHEITGIPGAALRRSSLADFSPEERMRWSSRRETKRTEDRAYCLLGIFNVSMPPVYGEGDRAFDRLKDAIARDYRRQLEGIGQSFVPSNSSNLVVRGSGPTSTPAEEATLLDCRKTMLASLSFEQMDSRRSTIKTAYSSTCQWLLKHRAYLDWIDPEQIYQHCGFLWINGKPGAGKSTLVKFALACADKARPESEILLSFFFNARGDELEKSTVGMYRALLFQLLTKMTDLQDLLDDVDNLTDQRGSPVWTVETLCRLLSAATARLGHRRLKCFIDALDECDEQRYRFRTFQID
jgi:Heterokaryon incompatibility protein (HET)/NACHT domain